MRTIRFGKTDVLIPAIGLGTWAYGGPNTLGNLPVGWTGHDDERARQALRRAYHLGITHWDTADVYGNGRAEQLIGSVWGEVTRADIFLASKVGWDRGRFKHFYHPQQMRAQLERTLRYLHVDHLDLYYLHHCDFGKDARYLNAAVEQLHRFRDEGKTRFLGLSDWDPAKIAACADRVQPDVVQVYRNALDDAYATSGLKQWVDRHDAGVVFFSPLKHGVLLGKYETPPSFGNGDMRSGIAEFADPEFLDRARDIRRQLEHRFAHRPQPVLHALLESILTDAPSGVSLIGLRNPEQVGAAAAAEGAMDPQLAEWVRGLYAAAR